MSEPPRFMCLKYLYGYGRFMVTNNLIILEFFKLTNACMSSGMLKTEKVLWEY